MKYGYARVSTLTQAKEGNSLQAQSAMLKNAGAEEIYSDAFTGKVTDRPELTKLTAKMKYGDTLIVTKFDRIARSLKSGLTLIDDLIEKGVTIHVLNIGLIDNTAMGRLIRNILLALAEWERDMIIQRTYEGKQIAKLRPEYREGRPPKFSKERQLQALKLLEHLPYREVTARTGISKSTLVRLRALFKSQELGTGNQ